MSYLLVPRDHHHAHVADVRVRRAGADQAADAAEEVVGVVAGQIIGRIELTLPRGGDHLGVDDRAGGVGRAVFAVGAAGKHDDPFRPVLQSSAQRGQRQLLVASAEAAGAASHSVTTGSPPLMRQFGPGVLRIFIAMSAKCRPISSAGPSDRLAQIIACE